VVDFTNDNFTDFIGKIGVDIVAFYVADTLVERLSSSINKAATEVFGNVVQRNFFQKFITGIVLFHTLICFFPGDFQHRVFDIFDNGQNTINFNIAFIHVHYNIKLGAFAIFFAN